MKTLNERGVVLLLVIVFGLILSIIGIAAIENAGQQRILNKNLLSEHRAHQLAYAGIELGRGYIFGCKFGPGTLWNCTNYEKFPEHISGNRNPIIVPIPTEFQQQIQNYGSLSVSITPDLKNTTQVLLPATDQNMQKSIYGLYTISSTATITSGVSGTMDVIKNMTIRMYVQRTGFFLNFIQPDLAGQWYPVTLSAGRSDFTMLGFLLVAGGVQAGTYLKEAEELIPNSNLEGWFIYPTGSMNVARAEHTATLLGTGGDVLIAGGTNGSGNALSSAEIYTYTATTTATTFSLTANPMMAPRSNACATLLTDGNVLIAGGYSTGGAPTPSAEVYTTATGKFNFTSPMALPRAGAAAVRLNDGSVLMVGGIEATGVYAPQAELYTYPAPSAPTMHGVFTLVGALAEPRYLPTATLLDDGTVLVRDGYTGNSHHPLTAEIYNPATHTFTPTTGAPIHSRFGATASLLVTGQVLITGGIIDGALGPIVTDSAELYNPLDKTFYPIERYNYKYGSSTLLTPRVGHQALLGIYNWVLIAGGSNNNGYPLATELFYPGLATEEIQNTYVEDPYIRKTH